MVWSIMLVAKHSERGGAGWFVQSRIDKGLLWLFVLLFVSYLCRKLYIFYIIAAFFSSNICLQTSFSLSLQDSLIVGIKYRNQEMGKYCLPKSECGYTIGTICKMKKLQIRPYALESSLNGTSKSFKDELAVVSH